MLGKRANVLADLEESLAIKYYKVSDKVTDS